MRRLAQTVALLSVPLAFAACGDDVPSNVDATVIFVYPDGGIPETGSGGGDAGCPSASFLSPVANANLTAANDKNGDSCADGFQIDVQLAVGAVNGTPVTLLANNTPVGSGVVTNGVVTFEGVALGTQGAAALVAQISSIAGCSVTNNVMVNCTAVSCNITKPVISESHPKLNGVPADQGGDRVSSPGSDYQASFEVTTNIEENQPVELRVSRAMNPESETVLTAVAKGGKATFAGVTLRPDGDFVVQAVCTSALQVQGRSIRGTYSVDTELPALTVTEPLDGKHFNPSDMVEGRFKVCATTSSEDGVGLGTALANGGRNFCAGVNNSAPECVSTVTAAGGGGTGCVEITCPGGAPFDLRVSLTDSAGNRSTKTVQGVSCASALPSVSIVVPADDSPMFLDMSKRLLSASADQAFKDLLAETLGAQANVVACTDKATGKARLLAGLQGGVLEEIGGEVAVSEASVGDGCPAGLAFVAKWNNVTLAQSSQNADTKLQSPTELRVRVTDISTALGESPPTRLWVDSEAPSVTAGVPNPLCGRIYESPVDVATQVILNATAPNVTLTVAGASVSMVYVPTSFSGVIANFGTVTFYSGDNQVSAVTTDESGNRGQLAPACLVKVGEIPIVTWLSPAPGKDLCAQDNSSSSCLSDSDGAAGWQGTLRVRVEVAGNPANSGTVSFKAAGMDLGTVDIANGEAALPGISLEDGASLQLEAVTSDITGTGVGQANRSVTVDTDAPSSATNLALEVKDRRDTSFALSWTAPGDGNGAVTGYVLKVSENPIDGSNFDAAETVNFTGTPAAMGGKDSVEVGGRLIEKDYYFAVAPTDAVGNRGEPAFAGPIKAQFRRAILTPPSTGPANERFGSVVDGFGDFDGDGFSDILVGSVSGSNAYIFFGMSDVEAMGGATTQRVTTLVGPSGSTAYGRAFVDAGDLDGDGRSDIAISASRIGNGRLYIMRGRNTWAPSYSVEEQSDFVIELGSSYVTTRFAESLARLGNFDGLGGDDLAIGVPSFNAGRGRVIVIFGGTAGLVTPAPGVVKTSLGEAQLSMLTIDGEASEPTGRFGERVLGVSYTGGSSNTLVVSAPGGAPGTPGNAAGKVYTFQNLIPGSLVAGSPAAGGLSSTAQFGESLALIGQFGAATSVAVGAIGNVEAGPGYVDLYVSSPAAGLFSAPPKRFINSAATALANAYGRVVSGSGFSGSSITANLLGDESPDFVSVAYLEGTGVPRVYVVDGAKVGGLGNVSDVVGQAAATLNLPEDWARTSVYQRTATLRDLNKDGAADIAIGEYSTGAIRGRLVIFY